MKKIPAVPLQKKQAVPEIKTACFYKNFILLQMLFLIFKCKKWIHYQEYQYCRLFILFTGTHFCRIVNFQLSGLPQLLFDIGNDTHCHILIYF